MWSRGDDYVANRVFWDGWLGYEPETAGVFFELAGSSRVTLDVGAHVGFYALLAALANPRGQVYAFEPLPSAYERLLRNAALNGVRQLSCLRMAVGGRDERHLFYHVGSRDGIPSSSSLSRTFMETELCEYELHSEEVAVVSMDGFLRAQAVDHVDLVKLDTESTEDEVLRGMAETLRRDRPNIICELLPHGPAAAIEAILEPYDYQYFLLTDQGLEPLSHLRPDPTWRNLLFLADGRSLPQARYGEFRASSTRPDGNVLWHEGENRR